MTPSSSQKPAEPSPSQRPVELSSTTAVIPSSSQRPVEPSRTPSSTSSKTVRPSNVDVLDYTSRPNEPMYTVKPTCNIWVCPEGYDIYNQNGKVVCRYYKLADYNIVDLPDTPEGPGGSYADYFCPKGMKMVSVRTSKDPTVQPTYYCEAYTDARFLRCPTASRKPLFVSAFPSLVYKTPVRTASRKPLFFKGSLEFVGADLDALVNPIVLKKLIYGLSCTVKDSPKSILLKEILQKVGTQVQRIPFVLPEIGDATIDCPAATVTPSPKVNLARRLQSGDEKIEVVYSYQAADETYTPPTEVNVSESALLTEVTMDVSLGTEPASVVAYSMTSETAVGVGGGNQVAGNGDQSPSDSTGAMAGGIIGAGIGAAIVAAAVTYQVVKRRRKEQITKVVKNPANAKVVDAMDSRWASSPSMV